MPAATKKTPVVIKKLLDLHERGASGREISEALDLTPPTISRWLKELGLEPNGGNGPRRGRTRKRLDPETEAAIVGATEAAADVDSVDSLETATRRLAFLRSSIDKLQPAMLRGEVPASSFNGLLGAELKYAAKVEEFRAARAQTDASGKPPVDVAAAEAFDAKLRALVARAEASSRCQHCGKPPFHGAGK